MTYIINFIGGPGVGKTTIGALVFVKMKIMGMAVEFAQEYVKQLVWKGNFKKINNQYLISSKQYSLIKSMNGHVDFIISDGCLLNGIYYGEENKNNCSNVQQTNEQILKWFGEFKNINIILMRGNFKYEMAGRYHTEDEAIIADKKIKKILDNNNIEYFEIISSCSSIDKIIDYIKLKSNIYDS